MVVNGRRFPVNTGHLSIYSPVFEAMFQCDMKERSSDEVELKEIESADHFADFLAMISPQRILPNRKFVVF